MPPPPGRPLLPAFLTASAVVVAGWVAYDCGGGAEARDAHSVRAAASPPPPPHRGKTLGDPRVEVDASLLAELGHARIDAPTIKPALQRMNDHWRRMQVPWLSLPPEVARFTTSLAFRTSKEETAFEAPSREKDGGVWRPDVRQWNMSEGSFDQREAIFAPAPASFTFHLTLPEGAALDTAPAVVRASGDVTFQVAVLPAGASSPTVACTFHIPRGGAGAWQDEHCPLAAWAGQTVDLTLSTAVDASEDGESTYGLALWGTPEITAIRPPSLPYNVLFIVVDALRPDAVASFHSPADDAARAHATYPPLDAWLPRVPGLTPSLDALAERGVRFVHASSVATWTRPGTLAMFGGSRTTELGVDATNWVTESTVADRYYLSDPPLIGPILHKAGAATRAFVNNFFMVGYATVGFDMGFSRIDDHRYRSKDTAIILEHATSWLKANKARRFFAFCNFNSPHEPWDPPERFLDRIPPPPEGPREEVPRRYMGEVAKDDAAIGELLRTLDETGLRKDTLVIVTGDHGETLSAAHTGWLELDHLPMRFHHAAGNYEETTRVPILLSLPGVLPEGTVVEDRVRTIDLAPTVLELEGLPSAPKMSGASLVSLARGGHDATPRAVVSEGRMTKAILLGKWRLLLREGKAQIIYPTAVKEDPRTVPEELYDLEADPGERHDVAREHPEIVASLKARLADELRPKTAGKPSADPGTTAVLSLRFAGGGRVHDARGVVRLECPPGTPLAEGTVVPPFRVRGVGIDDAASRHESSTETSVAFSIPADRVVGLDVEAEAGCDVGYSFAVDDRPIDATHVYAGAFGLAAPQLATGVRGDAARTRAFADRLPLIDPTRDDGLFIVSSRTGEGAPVRGGGGEAEDEMRKMLEAWGYAHKAPK